jgi:hypothetical protein
LIGYGYGYGYINITSLTKQGNVQGNGTMEGDIAPHIDTFCYEPTAGVA